MTECSLRVGVIGAGKFSHRHVAALQKVDRVKIVAACRTSPKALKAFCSTYDIIAYTDHHQLLADRSINAILISTPHHLHAEMAVAAVAAGKHILIEKPLATNLTEARMIFNLTQGLSIKCMVGHVTRFTLPFIKAKAFLDRGEIGSIVHVSTISHTCWMGPERKPWHLKRRFGGGYLLTLGVHQLDAVMALVGSKVSAVTAVLGANYHNDEVDDSSSGLLTFENGVSSIFSFQGFRKGIPSVRTDVYGTKGAMRLDANQGLFVGKGNEWQKVTDTSGQNWLDQSLVREWMEFRDAVEEDRLPSIDCAKGLQVMEVVEAINESAKTQRKVFLDEMLNDKELE